MTVLSGAEREAFAAYVATRSTALMRTAYLLTGDRGDAEDLLQTALAQLALHWQRVQRAEALDSYVRRTMVNAHTSYWRRRRVTAFSVEVVPEPPAVPDGVDAETRLVLWQALGKLTPGQRVAVVLRYYEDFSEAETAQILQCSVGNVKSQTSRALQRLRSDSGIHFEEVRS